MSDKVILKKKHLKKQKEFFIATQTKRKKKEKAANLLESSQKHQDSVPPAKAISKLVKKQRMRGLKTSRGLAAKYMQ